MTEGEPNAFLKLIQTMFEAVKERPEAALAAIAMTSPVLLILVGVNHWFAMSAPIVIYLAYCVSSVLNARSSERMAEREVERIDAEGRLKITKLAEKHLDKVETGEPEN